MSLTTLALEETIAMTLCNRHGPVFVVILARNHHWVDNRPSTTEKAKWFARWTRQSAGRNLRCFLWAFPEIEFQLSQMWSQCGHNVLNDYFITIMIILLPLMTINIIIPIFLVIFSCFFCLMSFFHGNDDRFAPIIHHPMQVTGGRTGTTEGRVRLQAEQWTVTCWALVLMSWGIILIIADELGDYMGLYSPTSIGNYFTIQQCQRVECGRAKRHPISSCTI